MKKYKFDYNIREADAEFTVDTDKFTKEIAQENLDFFLWDYDEDNCPIDEIMKKYALEAMIEASNNGYSHLGVRRSFENKEGFYKVDGSSGITLNSVNGYFFNPDDLEMEVADE